MISRLRVWLLAFTKRLLQKHFFIFLLCIFPVLSIGISIYSQSKSPLIQVALFNENSSDNGSELGAKTIKALIEQNSVVHFYEVQSAEQLYDDVKKRKAECGYIFTKEYTMENILNQQQWSKSVRTAESPGSMLTGSINELVFSSFFRFFTGELVQDYIQKPGVLEEGQDVQAILKEASVYYEEYCQAEGIFSFEKVSDLSDTTAQAKVLQQAQKVTNTFLTDMCRGILSVLILLAAMCGALYLIQDKKTSLLLPLPFSLRPFMELLEMLAPACLMAASGLIGLAILPASQPLWKEAFGLISYIPAAVLFTYLLLRCIRTESLFRTLLPLLTLGALLFAPVFLDFSPYAKVMAIPKYLFINSYYLEMATGGIKEFLTLEGLLVIFIIIWLILCYLPKKQKNN